MRLFGGVDTVALKQHFGKKIMELEKEKRTVQVKLNMFAYFIFQYTLISRLTIVTIAARERSFVS